MNPVKVTVVDYGIGNLYSVQRALEVSGAEAILASDPAEIDAAERLILPGVGAFADGMAGLRSRGLVEPLRRYAASGKALLGICLGMQMLAEVSEEFGEHEGLGILPGRVVAIPAHAADGSPLRRPHIGWSAIAPPPGQDWDGSCLEDIRAGDSVYLVHSFHLVPSDPAHMLAQCDYGGNRLTAAVRRGNVVGCQFHPEKSGVVGLSVIRRFIDGPVRSRPAGY